MPMHIIKTQYFMFKENEDSGDHHDGDDGYVCDGHRLRCDLGIVREERGAVGCDDDADHKATERCA